MDVVNSILVSMSIPSVMIFIRSTITCNSALQGRVFRAKALSYRAHPQGAAMVF